MKRHKIPLFVSWMLLALTLAMALPALAQAQSESQTVYCRLPPKTKDGQWRCVVADSSGQCPADPGDGRTWDGTNPKSCKCSKDTVSGSDECVQIENPLASEETDVAALIGVVIKAALGISGAIALVMFFWGARAWVTAQGNSEEVKKGLDTMVWTGIGLIILFGSYILVNIIIQFVTGTGVGAAP